MNTNDKYTNWINENIPKSPNLVRGKCDEMCNKMLTDFPELKKIRGFYYDPVWGKRQHWWLVDDKEEIIDPTSHQFPSKGQFKYEKLDESKPEPIGKCLNCGKYCFEMKDFCCCKCQKIYVDSLYLE